MINFVGSPLHVFLLLSLAATLSLNSSSPLFLFSLFNTIVLVIVVVSYTPSGGQIDVEEDSFGDTKYENYNNGNNYNDDSANDNDKNDDDSDDDNTDKENGVSDDGYDEDVDDDGSDGEIGWDDDEEIDDHLESRIEAFISKVTRGWREEWLIDNGDIWFV